MHFVSWIATEPLFEQLGPDHSKNENDLGDWFELWGNIAQMSNGTTMPNQCFVNFF